MAASRIQIQAALQKPYDRILFAKEVLSPVFGHGLSLNASPVPSSIPLNKSEGDVISNVSIYGRVTLEDNTEISCYEIVLQPKVRVEQSRVAIQRYVRKMLTVGQAALVNFITPQNRGVWRLTLIAKDSELTSEGIRIISTNAKRYTYLLGINETCKTAAERFETLSAERKVSFQALVNAFSVEKLSESFFDEYTLHYEGFVQHLNQTAFKRSVFKGSEKAIRDFTKKLLGRIVFLYFVQKKGWLGATNTDYRDGIGDFMKSFFKTSGGNDSFYASWLTTLFFQTLNKERKGDDFLMPNGTNVKVPFLNGGLFDMEEYDQHLLTFNPSLFHNKDFEDTILTEQNRNNSRGFLDFLNSFNFTVHEDSPDDHIIAVDPEMLGHIFENLLEDNKDKGTFYTPKEVVHYMCQESLLDYLDTKLKVDRTLLERLVKHKDVDTKLKGKLRDIDQILDIVKICDPAIGSGAFPMGLLQEIFTIKEVIAFEEGTTWKPAEVKENIIQNSIYGVDIEKGAVDIARLRFWLSLVVDEDKPRPLPNLDYKIVVGDSLVSKFENEIVEVEWERIQYTKGSKSFVENIQRILKEIAEKQKTFFKPETKDKRKLNFEIRNLKLELLINQVSFNREKFIASSYEKGGFAPSGSDIKFNTERRLHIKNLENLIEKLQALKRDQNKPFEHFDYLLDFPEILNPNLLKEEAERGFDIIIANPPYLKERDNAHIFKDVNGSSLGKLWHQGKMDYWFYFLHKAIDLNKDNGTIAFITSRYWLNSQGASKLIDRIQESLSFTNVVDIGKLKVFNNVAGHHMIHIYKKGQVDSFIYKRIKESIRYINLEDESPNVKLKAFKKADIFKNSNIILSTEQVTSSVKCIQFEEVFDSSIGVQESVDKVSSKQLAEFPNKNIDVGKGVFVLTEAELKQLNLSKEELRIIKPYLDPNDVKRYQIEIGNPKFLIYSDKVSKELIANRSEFSRLKKHLDELQEYITSSNKPYGIHRARQRDYFEKPKLIFKGMFVNPEFTYDTAGYYFGFSFSSITQKDKQYSLKYLLAILNSKFARNWFYTNGKLRGAGVDIGVEKLRTFPVAETNNQSDFIKLVDYILFLRTLTLSSATDQLMPTYFEQIIDGIVYELYFPELLRKHEREVLKHLGDLPWLTDKMAEQEKLHTCSEVFNRLDDKNHPVRTNLFYMNSIPEIEVIEGKNENN